MPGVERVVPVFADQLASKATGQQVCATATPEGRERPSDGKCRLIRGGGLVSRISDDKEPQISDIHADQYRPAGGKDTINYVETVLSREYEPEWSRGNHNDFQFPYPDSDESDDDVLPLGALRPLPCDKR